MSAQRPTECLIEIIIAVTKFFNVTPHVTENRSSYLLDCMQSARKNSYASMKTVRARKDVSFCQPISSSFDSPSIDKYFYCQVVDDAYYLTLHQSIPKDSIYFNLFCCLLCEPRITEKKGVGFDNSME